MSIEFTLADNMEAMLAINHQCTLDVQDITQDAIKIIEELRKHMRIESYPFTSALTDRLMKAHQDAIGKIKELGA